MKKVIVAFCAIAPVCGSCSDGRIDYCDWEDHNRISISKDLKSFSFFDHEMSGVVSKKKIVNCGNQKVLCLDGPFYIKITKLDFSNKLKQFDVFEISSESNGNRNTILYSKNDGILNFKVYFYEKNFPDGVPILREKCTFEFEKLRLLEN